MIAQSKTAMLALAAALCLPAATLLATQRYVSADGTYGTDIQGAVCYTDIQTALDACNANDTVWVKDGFVCDSGIADTSQGNSRICINKSGVTLRGESGDWRTGPVIRGAWDGDSGLGENAVRCVIAPKAAAKAKIIGFQLLDGATKSAEWGGCFRGDATSANMQTLRNCLVAGGKASYGGGLSADALNVVDCVVSNCQAATGCYANGQRGGNAYGTLFILNCGPAGGAYQYAKNADTVVSNCTFIGNSSSAAGAAVSVSTANGTHRFIDCRFFDNASGTSAYGPIYGYGTYTNCVFSGNSAYYGGAVASYTKSKIIYTNSCTFASCVFTNNCDTICQGAVGYFVSFTNCRIEGNGGNDNGPLYGCSAYNTLIANNVSKKQGGGIYAAGDNVLVNCTVVSNRSQNGATAYVPAGGSLTLVNTILALNDATQPDNPTLATNSFLTVSGVAGEGNIVGGNPMLHGFQTKKPWRPRLTSPCRDGGLVLPWMSDASHARCRDLDGRPLLSADGTAPIGCYNAAVLGGITISVR